MARPKLLVASLIANAALGTILALALHRNRQAHSLTNVTRPALTAPDGDPRQPTPTVSSAVPTAGVNWDSLWRSGYRSAAAALRAIGFPESVVQDIVLGKINRCYGPDLLRLRLDPWRFWQPEQRRGQEESRATRDREAQVITIEGARAQAAWDALGVRWEEMEPLLTGQPSSVDKYLGGIATQSKQRAAEILRRYDALERAVIRGANGTIGSPERTELDALYRDKLQELRQFLSPDELEEYELRASPTASRLRQLDLIGFDPTEQEFRAIYRVRKSFDEQFGSETPSASEGEQLHLWESQARLEETLESELGPERYRDYRRSMDYTFRGLVELTAEFDVSCQAASQVHQLRETALQAMHQARTSAEFSPDQQAAVLKRIRSDAEGAVRQLLGEAAYNRYRQMEISAWLNDFESL